MSVQDNIKIPSWFAGIVVVSGVSWLAWMSVEIVSLKTDMSAVKEHLQIKTASNHFDEMKDLAKQ